MTDNRESLFQFLRRARDLLAAGESVAEPDWFDQAAELVHEIGGLTEGRGCGMTGPLFSDVPWEFVEDDVDRRLGSARVFSATNTLVHEGHPGDAALIVAAVNATIVCPRCEGQKYDCGACGLCGNLGRLGADGEMLT